MRFVKNFTPPDYQAKNFTPFISQNFNSFSDKNTKNMSENGEKLHLWQKFYTAAGSDKSHLWLKPPQATERWLAANTILGHNMGSNN